MLRAIISIFLVFITFTLSACSSSVTGLNRYSDVIDGYQFFYPNGWVAVDVRNSNTDVDVVYRDIIEEGENLSLIISDIDNESRLTDLGTPTDVGYRFMQIINQNTNNGREAELISAQKGEQDLQDYYLLEYKVKLGDNQYRHNLANVAVKNGKLYTFNISATEYRWQKVKDLFTAVAKSFTLS